MNLCVIGTGYVGLVTGTVFADLGYTVFCADKDADKIRMLNSGVMPIFEPGIEEMVKRNVCENRLFFSADIADCVRRSDIVFIAVGTPPGADGYADLTDVREVAVLIARNMHTSKIVVNKSTVPVGTADMVRELIEANCVDPSVEFDVVSNPEFLREGNAIADTLHPDRVVIGASNPEAAERIEALYAPLECPIVVTDVRSAELIKYASNAFLATKISFINSIANMCELAGADVLQVAKGMGLDKRIGPQFLSPGLGWGGSCFGKDTSCLIVTAERLGCDLSILRAVVDVNSRQPGRFVERILKSMGGRLDGKTVAVLGLAFKPNTDDLRDGQSLHIISELTRAGARVKAYDPIAMENAKKILPDVEYCESAYDAAAGSDALVFVTEWNEFRFLDLAKLKELMRSPVIFDGRNILNPERVRAKGFTYHCIGRPANGVPEQPAVPDACRQGRCSRQAQATQGGSVQ